MKPTIAQFLKINNFPFTVRDENENKIYHEDSNGYWWKREYDSNGHTIYYEDSDGKIIDKRNKEVVLTLYEIASKFNIPVVMVKSLTTVNQKK